MWVRQKAKASSESFSDNPQISKTMLTLELCSSLAFLSPRSVEATKVRETNRFVVLDVFLIGSDSFTDCLFFFVCSVRKRQKRCRRSRRCSRPCGRSSTSGPRPQRSWSWPRTEWRPSTAKRGRRRSSCPSWSSSWTRSIRRWKTWYAYIVIWRQLCLGKVEVTLTSPMTRSYS